MNLFSSYLLIIYLSNKSECEAYQNSGDNNLPDFILYMNYILIIYNDDILPTREENAADSRGTLVASGDGTTYEPQHLSMNHVVMCPPPCSFPVASLL